MDLLHDLLIAVKTDLTLMYASYPLTKPHAVRSVLRYTTAAEHMHRKTQEFNVNGGIGKDRE